MSGATPLDPFRAEPPVHTCTAPTIPTETIAEIMRERFRRVDECFACAHGAMLARSPRDAPGGTRGA